MRNIIYLTEMFTLRRLCSARWMFGSEPKIEFHAEKLSPIFVVTSSQQPTLERKIGKIIYPQPNFT